MGGDFGIFTYCDIHRESGKRAREGEKEREREREREKEKDVLESDRQMAAVKMSS